MSKASQVGFVAVHVGAGNTQQHLERRSKIYIVTINDAKHKAQYLNACRRACQLGVDLLRQNELLGNGEGDNCSKRYSSREVVERMIITLEDEPRTNAGLGSNLNLDGRVECDASIMDGTSLGFGAVGAVSDFKNPIRVASKMLEESDRGLLSLGRIPPLMLVGPGARAWVETMNTDPVWAQDLFVTSNQALITDESHQNYLMFTKMLQEELIQTPISTMPSLRHLSSSSASKGKADHGDSAPNGKRSLALENNSDEMQKPHFKKVKTHSAKLDLDKEPNKEHLQDTVGAICVDQFGHIAAGVSSGGIALKFPGRIGEAAVFGAGCWAQDADSETFASGVGCSFTGAGEQIMKTLLAKTTGTMLNQNVDCVEATNTILDQFRQSPLIRSHLEKNVGFIAVKTSLKEQGKDENQDNEAVSPVSANGQNGDTMQTEESSQLPELRTEFIFAHTSKTMGVGYMSTNQQRPTAIMSQKNPYTTQTVFCRKVA